MGAMSVASLLARQPAAMRRARVELGRRDLLPLMQPWGAAWRELCAELGVACPDELVALGDAMAEVYVYVDVDGHAYAMLTPEQARDERAFLATCVTHSPSLTTRTCMVPVFGEDSDLLLLAQDGRVHALAHDDPSTDEVVAASLAELVAIAQPGAVNPA
jgi:hypothetical protein